MTSFANSSTASFGSPVLSKIGVAIGPGATVLTRMPRPASSAAVVRARDRNAALVAAYTLAPAVPFWSTTLVFRMNRRAIIQQRQRFLDGEVCSFDIDIEL